MSAPDPLRTPKVFPRIDLPSPIPRSATMNLLTLTDDNGDEWIESLECDPREAKAADEGILKAQIAYDEQLKKEIAIAEQQMVIQFRRRLFKNVLDGSIPQGKK